MLSLEKVKSELGILGYPYVNNILCGHTKSKVKWILPAGAMNVVAFEQATSYLFGFSDRGINLFPVQGDWEIAENLFLPWDQITLQGNFANRSFLPQFIKIIIDTCQHYLRIEFLHFLKNLLCCQMC